MMGRLIKQQRILERILVELVRAERLHSEWPEDQIHQAAIVAEEAGGLVKAVNDLHKCPWDKKQLGLEAIEMEAIQLGAMVFRFLLNLRGGVDE